MEKPQITDLVTKIQKNGTTLTHRDFTTDTGVREFHCSAFYRKKSLLLKGECSKPVSQDRNALIVLIDIESGRVVGKLVNQRKGTNLEQGRRVFSGLLRVRGWSLFPGLGRSRESGRLQVPRLR